MKFKRPYKLCRRTGLRAHRCYHCAKNEAARPWVRLIKTCRAMKDWADQVRVPPTPLMRELELRRLRCEQLLIRADIDMRLR